MHVLSPGFTAALINSSKFTQLVVLFQTCDLVCWNESFSILLMDMIAYICNIKGVRLNVPTKSRHYNYKNIRLH